jgi:hypothetical protein
MTIVCLQNKGVALVPAVCTFVTYFVTVDTIPPLYMIACAQVALSSTTCNLLSGHVRTLSCHHARGTPDQSGSAEFAFYVWTLVPA